MARLQCRGRKKEMMQMAKLIIYGFIGISLVGGVLYLPRLFSASDVSNLVPSSEQAKMSRIGAAEASSIQNSIQKSNNSGDTKRRNETKLTLSQELAQSDIVSLDQSIAQEQVLLIEQHKQGIRTAD